MTVRLLVNSRALWLCGCAAFAVCSPSFVNAQVTAEQMDIAAADQGVPAAEPTGEVVPDGSDIVVTGSRIVRNGYSAPTPTTVVDAQQIEAAAPTNIADFVNALPALAPTSTQRTGNAGTSSGTGGANFLNLRGLGPNRTLVLLDSRRVVASSLAGTVDVNNIPNALIKRVDVVTGGASAAYGSDAVAGVVNFILDKGYTGVKGSVQGGLTTRGDAAQVQASLTVGTRFAGGRGHFIISGEYAREEGVDSPVGRPWYQAWKVINNPNYTPTNGQPLRLVRRDANLSNAAFGGIITGGPLAGTTFSPGGGLARQFQYGSPRFDPYSSGGEPNDYTALVALTPTLQRASVFSRLSYDVSSKLNVFTELSYAISTASSNSAANYRQGTQSISIDNAYLDPAIKARMAALGLTTAPYGLISTGLGMLTPVNRRPTLRAVGGFSGDLGNSWNIDGYYQYGRSDIYNKVLNDSIKDNLTRALDAVRDGSGRIVCRSTLTNPSNGCVPINTFGGDAISDAARAYVNGIPTLHMRLIQHVAGVAVHGEPFSTWAGPVSVASGFEYRRESVGGVNDPISQVNGFQSGNFHASTGALSVREGFGEVVVPLANDIPFIKKLEFNGAARVTNYSFSGTVTTWKLGGSYEPVSDLRFRFTRSRDIRAPNLGDLYQAGQVLSQSVADPLNGNKIVPVLRNQTGNLALTPEIAMTTGVGFVYQPSWFPQFRASIDYYSINIKNAIVTLTNQQLVDRCVAGRTSLCNLVIRNGAGTITQLNILPINVSSNRSKGIDFDVSFRQDLPKLGANLDLRALVTHVINQITDDGFTVHDFAGENAGSTPRWRGLLSAIYTQGRTQVALSGQFISAGKLDTSWVEGVDIDDNHVASVWYMDLAGTRKIAGDKFEAFFRIENLFDKMPPRVAMGTDISQTGTNATLYDTIGRTIRVGFRFRL